MRSRRARTTCFLRRNSRASPCCISRKKGRWRAKVSTIASIIRDERDGRRELLRLDALEPPDQEVERLGDDAQVEVLLGGEVAVERALADPRGLRDVVHADHVVGAGGEDARRRPHDLLALRRLPRRLGRGLHGVGSALPA